MPFDDTARQRDAELLAAYASGDLGASETLMAEHAPRVLHLALRMLGNQAEAEEVTQEAMLRLWKIAPDWRAGEARISTWLHRVASNLCLDRLRKTRAEPMPEGYDAPDTGPGAEDEMMLTARAKALRDALDELPERQRLAIVLRHLEEMANPEIADVMELSVEAVESLLARGRRALKGLMADRIDALSFKEG